MGKRVRLLASQVRLAWLAMVQLSPGGLLAKETCEVCVLISEIMMKVLGELAVLCFRSSAVCLPGSAPARGPSTSVKQGTDTLVFSEVLSPHSCTSSWQSPCVLSISKQVSCMACWLLQNPVRV